ncbi:MAG: 8-oxoguanine deaminase [Candidatus Marinimicrobia bacterium]|nr:8-oxoguanine deaminase [Candidatus Neomarinimicrobiota bacterium]
MGQVLIQNALLTATMDDDRREFSGGHILIDGGLITSVGPEALEVEGAATIDASGMIVIPGMVNTHHHLFQTLTRNIPALQDAGLFQWLMGHYPIWREITPEAVNLSAKTGLLELMKSGATTSSDQLYVFPAKTGDELIDAEIAAARELGIRFQPTRGSMSLGASKGGLPPDDVTQSEDVIGRDAIRLIKRYHDDSAGAMIRISLAPCSPFSVTRELMESTVRMANEYNLQIHTHLAETADEEVYCRQNFNRRPVAYADDLGWLRSNAWFAHCVFLSDDEIADLGAAGVGVAHCPTSNMRLGSGVGRVRELLDSGVNVGLGVDGSASNDSSNMLQEVRNAMLLSRLRDEAYWLSARDVIHMATRGGAMALGRTDIGQLAAGKRADIAMFSLNSLEYAGGMSDPLGALVFTSRLSPVDYLFIDGQLVIQAGQSQVDEAALIEEHNRHADRMLQAAADATGTDYWKKSDST